MTYQENVIFVAERMAKRRYAKEFINELTPDEIEIVWNRADARLKAAYIKGKHADARIEISRCAEAIREFFFSSIREFFFSSFSHRMGCKEGLPATSFPEFEQQCQYINNYLFENGYAPSKEPTSTPNVDQASTSVPVSPDKENTCPSCGGETHTEYFTDGQNSTQIQPTYCLDCKWTQRNKI